jgi:hypothetical protein
VTAADEEHAYRVELVKALIPIMVQVVVMAAIVRRDDIARLAVRVRRAVTRQRQREHEDTQVALLRRDITAWEHQQAGR